MNIYHYHPITKEYIGAGDADLSPLDFKKGNEVWLKPANSTFLKPPLAKKNTIRKFINDKWELVSRKEEK